MTVYLLSSREKYTAYWLSILKEATVITSKELSLVKSEDILIVDKELYDSTLKIAAKIIVLDREPNFQTCISLLKKNVKAYGNIYMHSSHILSAVESLKDDKIWMYPDFVSQMMELSQETNSVNSNQFESKTQSLTSRESEITKLILKGFSNKEIAKELEISPNTIKVHTKHIYEKLDVTDRLSLFSLLK